MKILKGYDLSCVLKFGNLVKFPSSPYIVVTPGPTSMKKGNLKLREQKSIGCDARLPY